MFEYGTFGTQIVKSQTFAIFQGLSEVYGHTSPLRFYGTLQQWSVSPATLFSKCKTLSGEMQSLEKEYQVSEAKRQLACWK